MTENQKPSYSDRVFAQHAELLIIRSQLAEKKKELTSLTDEAAKLVNEKQWGDEKLRVWIDGKATLLVGEVTTLIAMERLAHKNHQIILGLDYGESY